MSLPKSEGGLGFRNIENFNVALLGKQVHRLLSNPNSLAAQILKGRYYPSTNILEAEKGYKPSFLWTSLLQGRDLLRSGLRCLIGDGSEVNIFTNNWLDTHPPRSPRLNEGIRTEVAKVKALFLPGTTIWNCELLVYLFQPEDVHEILKLKITNYQQQDLIGWNYTKDGNYTVKSGYWFATTVHDQEAIPPPIGDTTMKNIIWKLRTAPKLKHFLWRILSQAMAVGTVLKRRGIIRDALCRRCCTEEESFAHLFFQCRYAQAIWRGSNNHILTLMDSSTSFDTKIQSLLDNLNNRSLSDFKRHLPLWTLWRIWKSRNSLIYQKQTRTWVQDVNDAIRETQEWVTNVVQAPFSKGSRSMRSGWSKPKQSYVKCNYDCRFKNDGTPSGMGCILRDDNGFYLGFGHSMGRVCTTSLEVEIQTLLMASQIIWSKGYKRVIFEGDNVTVPPLIQGLEAHFGFYNWVSEIRHWHMKFEKVEISWVNRQSNQVADRLSKEIDSVEDFTYYHFVPHCIVSLLHEDHIISH